MVAVSFGIAVLFELALVIGLVILIRRRYAPPMRLFFVGMLTFLGSQAVHIPLLSGITELYKTGVLAQPSAAAAPWVNAITLGLAAGLCEELARLVGFKTTRRLSNSWGAALLMGAGHGGIEVILVALTVLSQLVVMLLAGPSGTNLPGLSAEQIGMVKDLWTSMPWHLPLAGAVERLTALLLHVTLSVMVWIAVTRRAWLWLAGAILYHALVDGVTVRLAAINMSAWGIEGVLLITLVINLFALRWMKARYSEPPALPAPEPVSSGA